MNNYSIDILLPTYNGEAYLIQQIESILQQTYRDFQLIIRDDGSTDNTIMIIEQFQNRDNRVKILNDNKGNLGLQKNIEHLMTMSDAELIFFSDQDDVWLKEKIETFIKFYKHIDEPILIHSNCFVTDSNLKVKSKFLDDKTAANQGIYNAYFNYFVQGASSMINRQLKKTVLPFPDEIYIHDRYIHIMAELLGKRIFIPEATMYYRQHNKNLIGSNSFLKKIKNIKLKSKFYLIPDKRLFEVLEKKNINSDYINNYLKLTSHTTSRWEKVYMIKKYGVSLRFKEKLLLLLNN